MSRKKKPKTTVSTGTTLMGLCNENSCGPDTSLFNFASVAMSNVTVMGTENRGFRPMWMDKQHGT